MMPMPRNVAPVSFSPGRALAPAGRAGVAACGFTLTEMVVTLAVLVLLIVAAVPPMSDFLARNRLASVQSEFAAAVMYARSEAARRGVPVLLAAASGGQTGNAYAGGWTLVLDSNANGAVDSGETVLRVREALGTGIKLHSGTTTLSFGTTGYLSSSATHTFNLCPTSGATAGYAITVPPSAMADVSAVTSCS